MKAKLFLALGALVCMAIYNCDFIAESDDTPTDTLGISFTVQDTSGNSIDTVGIHFMLNYDFPYQMINIGSFSIRNGSGSVTATMVDSILPGLPSEFHLFQNYPNPFNPLTTISYTLPEARHVLLQISQWHDSEPVRTLVDTIQPAGYHAVRWDAKDDDGNYVTNNIYAYQMTAGSYIAQREMCLMMGDPEGIHQLDCIPLATTDADGHAVIDYSVIPINKSINRTDEQGNLLGTLVVTDSLDFIFLREGYKSRLERVDIDTSKALNISVTLEPQ